MKLKLIDSKSIKVGYGNRHGYTTEKIYQCPCGKGVVT